MASKLLVVEDDEFLSEMYKELLTDEGYDVGVARDGQQGFDMASQGGYDLILLDIMLPKKDGLQILKELQEKKVKNGPVVLLTNLGQDSIVKDGLKSGAAGYLIKSSMTPDQVLHEVHVFLNKGK
jgi:DNA-binding response OmpR family regulator